MRLAELPEPIFYIGGVLTQNENENGSKWEKRDITSTLVFITHNCVKSLNYIKDPLIQTCLVWHDPYPWIK